MQSILTVVVVAVLGFFGLMIGLQVLVRMKARALRGKPVPPLPGELGKRVARGQAALLYFFSPGCGACRPITPQMKKLRERNPGVFLIDVSTDLAVARALGVMATPSTIEVAGGKVAGYHIGMVPPEVTARFA